MELLKRYSALLVIAVVAGLVSVVWFVYNRGVEAGRSQLQSDLLTICDEALDNAETLPDVIDAGGTCYRAVRDLPPG